MALRRFLSMLTAGLSILVVVAIWFFPSDDDFRVENPFWNGASHLKDHYPALPLRSLSDLPLSPFGTTLIIIPYLNGTDTELEQLKRFVTGGGRLVLADDYGHGNQILEYLGLEARFSGETLLDPVINYKNRQLPRITNLKPGPFTDHIDSLVLNHATCLVNTAVSDTLAASSSFSFLDLNSSGIRDENEPMGPLPVISRHSLGSGQVLLVADPSLFTNGTEKLGSNGGFIQNIATATTAALYLDQSHLPPSDLHQAKKALAQARGWLNTPMATAGLVIAALFAALKPVWQKNKEDSK